MKRIWIISLLLLCVLLIVQCSQKSVTAPEPDRERPGIDVPEEKVVPGGGPVPSTLGENEGDDGGGP